MHLCNDLVNRLVPLTNTRMKKPAPAHIKIYNHLGELRKKLDFPPTTLAERAGINRSTLFRIEQGEVIPSVLVALRLAKTLGTQVDEIFTLEETKFLTEEEKFDEYLKELVNNARSKSGTHS